MTVVTEDTSVFDATEERLAAQIEAAGEDATNVKLVAGAIGAAFLLYVMHMRRRLREELAGPGELSSHELREVNGAIFNTLSNRLALLLTPALASGYMLGMAEAQAGKIDPQMMTFAASKYAEELAGELHTTTSEALISGYQAQLNRRVAGRKALTNAIDVVGVPPKTMNALVNVWTGPGEKTLTDQPAPQRLKERADSIASAAISERASLIGETEAFTSKNAAKSIVWMYLQQQGDLPQGATKMWVTAKDERVCKVCGPMHKAQVELTGKFVLPTGEEVWSPAPHPRCRCTIVLRGAVRMLTLYDSADEPAPVAKSVWGVVSKARGRDPYDRSANGRFATVESRPAPPSPPRPTRGYADPEQIDPRVEAVLNQVFAAAPGPTAKPQMAAKPVMAAKPAMRAKPMAAKPIAAVEQKISANEQKMAATDPKLAAVRQRMAAQSPAAKMAAIRVNIKLDEAARMKAAAIKDPVAPTNQSTSTTNDRWVRTPNNEPVFGLFSPDINAHVATHHRNGDYIPDSSLLYADADVDWFSGGARGEGMATLRKGVEHYWKDKVLGDEPMHLLFSSDARMVESFHDEHGETMLVIGDAEDDYYISYEVYQQVWRNAVYGLSVVESAEVKVPAVRKEQNDTGAEEISDEYEASVNLAELADMMSITERVKDLRPIVGSTGWTAVNADGHWGGVMNHPDPANWRIIGGGSEARMQWSARDIQEPYPYISYEVEPEDL